MFLTKGRITPFIGYELFTYIILYYGVLTSTITMPVNHSIAGSLKYLMGTDPAHNRASQLQLCWLR